MVKEHLKKPFSEHVLNMFENTKLKFSIDLIPDCCFPRLNRGKNQIFLIWLDCCAWIYWNYLFGYGII